MPWQQDGADIAYEYDPETGLFRYDEADITVPRQSGKTTITLAKKVHRLTALARLWGPQRSTYIAQTRLRARAKLERDFADVLRSSRSFREVPNVKARPQRGTEWRLSLNNGSEHIQFGSGSYLQIDAPTRTAGHGDTLDDGTIDEAFAHEDDAAEMAMRPAMATRRNAQLWVISTAGDARSFYLWRKVLSGRKATESGQHGRTCYLEYSASDDSDPADPETWWGCMPALGITITEDFIRGEWERAQRKGQEGVDAFCRAYLNQWPEIPVLPEDRFNTVINPDLWASLADKDSTVPNGPVFAVDVNPERTWTSIAVSGRRPDGLLHGAVVDKRAGTEWVREAALKLPGRIVVMANSPAAALDLSGCNVEVMSRAEYVSGCQGFHDHVTSRGLRYRPDVDLDAALAGAVKQNVGSEGAWCWSRKGLVDISPLVSTTLAVTLAARTPAGQGRVLVFD